MAGGRTTLASQMLIQRDMTEDPVFRRSVLAFRWLLLVLWVGLIENGVLDVGPTALLYSSLIIGGYNVFHTILELGQGDDRNKTLEVFIRYADIVMITVAMVALHDVRTPVWAIYFLSLVGFAHFMTRREMAVYNVWVTANYLAAAAITQWMGYEVSWAYVTVVAICLALMGMNAAIIAGGEQRLRDVIRQAAITDSLTGLPNRHHFHEEYSESFDEAFAARRPLALMLIDVDHFKDINDTQGHPAGDDKLRDVAASLQGAVREGDMVARYGGDEFIAIARGASRNIAVSLAERLRDAARTCGASVSIGVAVCPEDGDSEAALIEAADTALYRAKADGRDCVRTRSAA